MIEMVKERENNYLEMKRQAIDRDILRKENKTEREREKERKSMTRR